MKNLGEIFSSLAEVLQGRESAMMERIAALEARVEALERRIAGMEPGDVAETGDAVEEIIWDDVDSTPVQPEIEIEFEFDEQTDDEPDDVPVEQVGKSRPDWYDWEVDIPGPYLDDIHNGIGLNDRILFLNVLFNGEEEVFHSAVNDLNGMERLVEAIEYLRERFPQWDEESDEVYRFYMTVRRRFNKQIQEE